MKDMTKRERIENEIAYLKATRDAVTTKLGVCDAELSEQIRHNRILRRVLWGSVALIVIELAVIIGVMK